MIRIQEVIKEHNDKNTEELAKLLNFLDDENIEYDLEPPIVGESRK